MRRVLSVLCLLAATTGLAARQPAAPSAFTLSVDSIMRGPELVGYPPSDLRWSGDSKQLYFEWRMPGEDEPATWVVGRDGGEPRRLTDDERRLAPLADGVWDPARRRVLGIDAGDVVMIDTVAHKRYDVTRTSATEAHPRWARGGTHVTFVRDNNLFIVPLSDAPPASADVPAGAVVQLTDVGPKKDDKKLTDSQRYLKSEEHELIEWVEAEAGRRHRREERERAHAIPRFELAERQYIVDAAIDSGEAFVYLLVGERTSARRVEVPRFVSESAYTEEIQARTKVGDAQEPRRLFVLNLATGDGVWAGLDGIIEPVSVPAPKPTEDEGEGQAPESKPEPAPKPKRDIRWEPCCYRPTVIRRSPSCARPTTPIIGSCGSIPLRAAPKSSIAYMTMRGCGMSTAASAG